MSGPTSAKPDALNEQEFFDLMQNYRHWPVTDQPGTIKRFEEVKSFVRSLIDEAVAKVVANSFTKGAREQYREQIRAEWLLEKEAAIQSALSRARPESAGQVNCEPAGTKEGK